MSAPQMRRGGQRCHKLPPPAPHFTRRDWCIAAALALIVFLLGLGQLTRGLPFWGDDSAAYIAEGIAIADGDLAEQAQRNLRLHPTPLPREVGEGGLIYVWGFPLLLALVYKLVGFDTVAYSNIFYYKLPSLICLALLAGVLYLFYRRRFSRRLAALLSAVFCLSGDFLYTVNILYSDVCFLFFSMLALLILELFLDSAQSARGPSVSLGVALGAALWYTYETRLNGVAVCAIALFAQILLLCGRRESRMVAKLPRHFLPYLVFFALRFTSERLLPPATSNMSDVGAASFANMLRNFFYYGNQTLKYLNQLTGFRVYLGMLLIVPCVIGFFTCGFRRENLPYTLLFAGTYLVNIALPYAQGLRYLYGALPILLLYLVDGARWLLRRVRPRLPAALGARLPRALSAALLAAVLASTLVTDYRNIASGGWLPSPSGQEVYSPQAIEMFHYIRENAPEDAIIACTKPRAVYLNTGRMGFRYQSVDQVLHGADYLLLLSASSGTGEREALLWEHRNSLDLVCAAEELSLYRVIKS